MKNLKSVKWLKDNLNLSNLVLLDASQHSTDSQSQKIECIPGSRHFDLKNKFSNTSSSLPNTFPSTEQFQEEARELGVYSDSIIVIYDNKGIYTSPRAWWMFKTFGHDHVFVLNGGLPAWKAMNGELSCNYDTPGKGNFKANVNLKKARFFEAILNNVEIDTELVIDARSAKRFNSEVPESRKGLRSGTIPKSINLPYTDVLNDNLIKTNEELETIFKPIIASKKPLIFSCGSGVTACILHLAFSEITNDHCSIYDGSWTEWGTLLD
ncbi:MAG: sulfurtransferase [Crocinitomicaceae bacterium]